MNSIKKYLKKNNLKTENDISIRKNKELYQDLLFLFDRKERFESDDYLRRMKTIFGQMTGWYKIENWEKVEGVSETLTRGFLEKIFELVVFVPSPNLNKNLRWFEIDEKVLVKYENFFKSEELLEWFPAEKKLQLLFEGSKHEKNKKKKEWVIEYVKEKIQNIELELILEAEIIFAIEDLLRKERENIKKK